MKSRLFSLTTLFLLLMLCGCGASMPSEQAAEQLLRQTCEKGEKFYNIDKGMENMNLISLVNFHKTNGKIGRNQGGVEIYTMEYEGEIEFVEDCFWDGSLRADRRDLRSHPMGSHFRPVKKGQRGKISGSVYFEKTENGWLPSMY